LGNDLEGERKSHGITKERLSDREDQISKLNSKIEALIRSNNEELNRLKTEYGYR
jgi:hypothetical protein